MDRWRLVVLALMEIHSCNHFEKLERFGHKLLPNKISVSYQWLIQRRLILASLIDLTAKFRWKNTRKAEETGMDGKTPNVIC